MAEYAFLNAEIAPERLAIASETHELTYSQLADEVRKTAHFLLGLGISPGDNIAVLTTPRADAFILFLAINTIGAVWLGLNPRYRQPELQYILEDARPRFLFHIGEFRGRDYHSDIASLIAGMDFIKGCYALDGSDKRSLWELVHDYSSSVASEDVLANGHRSDFPAMLVYTSGSTGRPKGVLLPNKAMVQRSRTQLAQWPTRSYPVVYNPYPMNHIGSLHWVSSYAIVGGGTIHFRQQFEAEELLKLVETHKVNVLELFPTMYKLLLEAPSFDPSKLQSIEWHIYSGAPMPIDILVVLKGMSGRIGTSYGMSETCGSVTYARPDTDLETLAITIGRPVPEGEARLMSDDGLVSEVGKRGEIQVRPEYCMLGYLNQPDLSTKAFTEDGWLRTGDVAELLPDGNLRFVGRLSDMYKSGGYNVYPREIEIVLEAHPAIALAAVIGVPDPVFGEVGIAVVELKQSAELNPSVLKEWCSSQLADYKIPKKFELRQELPLLSVGKVDKVSLRAELRSRA
ncbi:class I adenylate-forming enzyme family protein [Microvirga sp. P5_D2]